MNGTTVFLTALGYVALLFAVAWWGDRGGRRFVIGPDPRARLCAEPGGLLHVLDLLRLGRPRLRARPRLSSRSTSARSSSSASARPSSAASPIWRARRTSRPSPTSSSARYGKSQPAAALAALIALIGSAPYVALQLKSITPTLLTVVDSFDSGRLTPGAPRPRSHLAVALLLAAFAMAFGTRRIDPNEHQDGLILAISVESVVKLVAFLAVGAFVVWGLYGGIGDLTQAAAAEPRIAAVIQTPPDPGDLGRDDAAVGVRDPAAAAPVPRRVVENHGRAASARAAWLFPPISSSSICSSRRSRSPAC